MYSIEINDAEVSRLFARLAHRLTDMTEVMDEIGMSWVHSTKVRVEAGLTPEGSSFAPRSPVTLARYLKEGGNFGLPLNRSGEMRQGIFHAAGPDYVEIGSNAPQAAVMQFGAKKGAFGTYEGKGFGGSTPTISIPWGDIPARPFLGFSEQDRVNTSEILVEWLESSG